MRCRRISTGSPPYNTDKAAMSHRLPLKFSTLVCLGLFGSSSMIFAAADKKLPIEETSNQALDISAVPPLTQDEIKQELGSDLADDIIVIRVTARPLTDKGVQLSLDDFLLISSKDGQRSEPFAPGQLAGSETLAVTENGVRRGLGDHHPSIGFGGFGIGGGSSPGNTPPPDTKMQESRGAQENPLLAAIRAKILPEKQITDPVTGLLFFQITGKVKAKDLELRYKGPTGTMALRFPDK
jgi:hypothetical protein